MKHATNFKRRMMARLRLALFALSLLTVIALFANCTTESKMESEIKKYIAENAVDPESYEFVKLVADTITVGKVCQRLMEIETEQYFATDSIQSMPDGLPTDVDHSDPASDAFDANVVGYIMHHRYRLKNGHGVVSIEDTNFPFDTKGKLIGSPTNEDVDYSIYEHVLKKKGLIK